METSRRDQESPNPTPEAESGAALISKQEAIDRDHRHNFLLLTLYQTTLRCGWIFKTESIIIPAVLDLIAGPGWVRGLLPVVSRFGQSFPPLVYANHLRKMPRKKWSLFGTSLGMSVSFVALAALFIPAVRAQVSPVMMVLAFLFLYMVFFVATGLNQIGFGTAQGKLIHAGKRGRLMMLANVVGATVAISLVAVLMPRWLTPEGTHVNWLFGFSGLTFVLSAFVVMFIKEPPDEHPTTQTTAGKLFLEAVGIFRSDRHFRLLCLVAAAYGCSLMLFPHYQALARHRFDINMDRLVYWVIIQNAGTAACSLLAGPLADWKGNRLALRVMMLGVVAIPIVSLILVRLGGVWGSVAFDWMFLLIGVTPITYRSLTNYTLELVPPSEHPRYLATLSLCIAAPVFTSPLLGLLIDVTSYELAFSLMAVVLFMGWLVTLWMIEPRHHPPR